MRRGLSHMCSGRDVGSTGERRGGWQHWARRAGAKCSQCQWARCDGVARGRAFLRHGEWHEQGEFAFTQSADCLHFNIDSCLIVDWNTMSTGRDREETTERSRLGNWRGFMHVLGPGMIVKVHYWTLLVHD